MTQTPIHSVQPLYNRDFHQWTTDTIAQLKTGQFEQLDVDNLIEEIASLGRRDRRELENRLRVLLSHLLWRCYVPFPNDFRLWEETIREQQRELRFLLKQSPSLDSYFTSVFDIVWQAALAEAQESYPDTMFPSLCPFATSADALLQPL